MKTRVPDLYPHDVYKYADKVDKLINEFIERHPDKTVWPLYIRTLRSYLTVMESAIKREEKKS